MTERIGTNVAEFLAKEIEKHRIPEGFLPLQAGVGNVSNSVMAAIGRNLEIPPFQMYTEVLQDSVLSLMMQGRVKFASTTALTLSRRMQDLLYGNPDFFRPRLVLRPQEITNSPEMIRRLGIMGTRWLVQSGVYPDALGAHGMSAVRPEASDVAEVHRIIMEELVPNRFRIGSTDRLRAVVDRLRDSGCDAVVLGCTELPIVLDDRNCSLPTLDSTRLLARAALRKAIA